MSENPDLILDVQIRNWVFFPIAVVTFLMGTILQHISMIVRKPPEPTQQKIRDGSNLARLNLLKVNYSLLPPDQFTARKMNFLDPEMGFFFQSRQAKNAVTALMNPEGIIQKTKDIMTSFLPQMLFGAWVRYIFGGFAVCKLPFPLSHRFRGMLQSGIEFTSRDLDVSYVSALSWYVLNLFGNQALSKLFLTTPNAPLPEMDSSSAMALNAVITDQVEMNWPKVIEHEKESLNAIQYRWELVNVEDELLAVPFGEKKP